MNSKRIVGVVLLILISSSCIKSGAENDFNSRINVAISSLVPSLGTVGDTIAINGINFTGKGTNTVVFNGLVAEVVFASSTVIKAIVPVGCSSGPVSVLGSNTRAVGPPFTYVSDSLLRLDRVTPLIGSTDSLITLFGLGFKKGSKVSINGVYLTIVSITQNKIVAKLPSGVTTGNILLTVINQKAVGPRFLYFKPGTLHITRYSFPIAFPGAIVDVYGLGFSPDASKNVMTFGGVPAIILKSRLQYMRVQLADPLSAGVTPVHVITGGVDSLGPPFFVQSPSLGVSTLADAGAFRPASQQLNDLTVDKFGNVFVVDRVGRAIYRADFAGNVKQLVGSNSPVNPFVLPYGITIDTIENVLVSDNYALYPLDSAGNFLFAGGSIVVVGLPGFVAGGVNQQSPDPNILTTFSNPVGLSTSASNETFLCDGGFVPALWGGSPIFLGVIASDYSYGVNTPTVKFFPCRNPTNSVYDESRFLYVTDVDAGAIYRTDLSIGSDNTSTILFTAGLNKPHGIAMDQNHKTLLVAESGANRIVRINVRTKVLSVLTGSVSGIPGDAVGSLAAALYNNPIGLATDQLGLLYVSDQGNHKVKKIHFQ